MTTARENTRNGRSEKESGRLLLAPFPLQGHISPMLQLATLLHSRGFSITIIHTRFNSPSASKYPDFDFEPLDDGLSKEQASTKNVVALIKAVNDHCEEPFWNCVERLLQEKKGCSIRCIISDVVMHFAQGVAFRLKLPWLALRTTSATSFLAFCYFFLDRRPIKDSELGDASNVELQPIREKDIPNIEKANSDDLYELMEAMMSKTKASTGIIWNTFEELEKDSLAKIREEILKIPVFPIGPLHKSSCNPASSLLVHDRSCMGWLDKQAPKSVIYVSFGSFASLKKKELEEAAWGLANSRQPFLWVVRPGLVGSEQVELPEGFAEEIEDRGVVVEWAPQQEVLAHEAVGGFWTHCGWNSTLEGICEGVPLLCCPCFGDQKVTARYASHVWGIGVQLENGLERGDIEREVRKLMVEKEGEETRKKIKAFKESAEKSLSEGGSSSEYFNRFVHLIAAL